MGDIVESKEDVALVSLKSGGELIDVIGCCVLVDSVT